MEMNPEWIAIGSEWVARYVPRVAGLIALLFASWIVAGIVRRATERALTRAAVDLTLTRFFSNLARYTVLGLALIAALGLFGVQTTSFAAVIASGGLAIGLAFQGTLSNFAAGVMLLVFRPFKAGDVISAAGEVGTVQEIELFTTELTTADNKRVIVPNSAIFGQKITNITHHPTRRVDVSVGIAYDADLDRSREVLMDAVKRVDGVLEEPAAVAVLLELGASSVDWQVRVWANTGDYWPVREALIREVKMGLDRARLGIPFPQVDVHGDEALLAALRGRAAGKAAE